MQFTAHSNRNAQIASSQVPSANQDRRNSLASQVEAFFMGRVSKSSNLAFPEYSDVAAPSQPVAPILKEMQDTWSVKVKVTYGDSIIKFLLLLTSGIKELMQEVSLTLDCVLDISKPPDQHGERNTSTACETPSHYVQTGMEGELFGQNEMANVFPRDFMGGPIALDTESGLIMVSRPPDQHGERNTSTACRTPSCNVETGMEVEPVGQNLEANVFRQDFMGGPVALNTDGLTFPECSDAVAPSQPMATILDTIPHLTGASSECAFQVKNQSMQFTANPYPNGLVDPHPQIALTQTLSENMERLEDRRNLLAPQKEPLPEAHVFGSVNWTVRSCSDLALSQPMPTIPHTTGCSEYWRNSLALLEEHLLEENDYGSINLTALSCFDPGPSQPMHTIPHTMPTIPQMMPLLTERQDMRSCYGLWGALMEELSPELLFQQWYVSVGRSFKKPLGNGLQSCRGFYQSVKQMGLSLNIDMSATAFIEPLPVIEFVAQVLGKDVYSRPLSDADRLKVEKALRGFKVEVTHRGNMRRNFPVDEEKNMKSVIDYFQEVYGFTTQHSHLPCLLVGSARKVNYLPMEACQIVEGQRYSKKLNDKQITSLLKLTCQRPKEQEAEILQAFKYALNLYRVNLAIYHYKIAQLQQQLNVLAA
ncbi:hypothetical protein RHSIM_Rhsim05G0037300 [Rhododendron simsii]|uniref:PAZ domain-containing protein n=1 Tax=Rhododendron simsii TaxID=118357 RepID=A0A834GVW0_RHOSS|nr:hypothetical protein RHSIM_Rhsim05G0037300 [Rhododendron simsii]